MSSPTIDLFFLGISLLALHAGSMWFPALGAFLGFADDDVITFGAGNRATNKQEVVGFADLDDFQVLGSALDLAHMAGHLHPAHDSAWEQALADCAGAAMPPFGAVGRITTAKPVAADDTFEAAALGHADGIHIVARSKEGRTNGFAGFDFLREVAEFFDPFHRNAVLLFDMAEQRFGHPMLFLVIEPELDSVVAVTLLGFALEHPIGAGEHDGYRCDIAVGVIDARLAELFSKKS